MAKRPVPKFDFKPAGQAIKEARKAHGDSRKKASDEMFLSPRYLVNVENKGQHPSLQVFYELVTRYGVSVYTPFRGQKASMIQDLEKGRVCEIRQINGRFVEDGKRVGIPTPFNDKIVELVLEIQEGRQTLDQAWGNLDRFHIPAL